MTTKDQKTDENRILAYSGVAFMAGAAFVVAAVVFLQVVTADVIFLVVGVGVGAVIAWVRHRLADRRVRGLAEVLVAQFASLRAELAEALDDARRQVAGEVTAYTEEITRLRGETRAVQQSVDAMAQVIVLHNRVLSEMQRALEATVADVDARTDNKISEIMAEFGAVSAELGQRIDKAIKEAYNQGRVDTLVQRANGGLRPVN
jgi:hypothetical protein